MRSWTSLLEPLGSLWKPWAHHGRPWAHFGDPWLHLGHIWGVLGAPWASLGLILETLGFILGSPVHIKLAQSGAGWYLADIMKTMENLRVFVGLRGRRLQDWHQNAILDALAAHLGCLDALAA